MTMPADSLSDARTAAMPVYDSARRRSPFVEELQELWRFRELVVRWASRNIKLRYKRSVLGILWTLIEPLMLMTILTVVFSTLFRFQLERYPIYLLSGLLLFDFFSRSTLQIIEETVASQGLASRVYVPRTVFAVATILTYLTNWAIALVPLLAIMLILGQPLSPALVTLPAGMVLTSLFALGVGLLVATLGASFHDFKLTYQVLLTAWLYATPIIYPLEIVPEKYLSFFKLNPLLYLCTTVRDPAFLSKPAPADVWLVAALISIGTAVLGWWVFTTRRSVFDYLG
jgi:ABC-type polysaccharide/polyol phosphate export permease